MKKYNIILPQTVSKENGKELLLFVGANTLFYFAFHGKVYSLLQTICHKVMASDSIESAVVELTVAFCIVILYALILLLLALFVNRYYSFLLGKGFKLWRA